MKTQAQNRLVGTPAKLAVKSALASAGKTAMDTASKAASASSKWKGFEMIILRSGVQNMIQMSFFEQAKVVIDGLEFSDGSKTLPQVERKLGRDSKVNKNDKI